VKSKKAKERKKERKKEDFIGFLAIVDGSFIYAELCY
jgi:hypothetical protein